MDRIILDTIPFDADEHGLMELLRIRPGTGNALEFSSILARAKDVARPRAAFGVASADTSGRDEVDIDGVRFQSRVLRVNLDKAGVVFPFIATCGEELEAFSQDMTGMLRSFWADSLMLTALGCAVSALEAHLKERLGGAPLSTMNPGSLEDWPLSEQSSLFRLLGDAAGAVGVRLTEKMVIRPLKSVSGISFVSEERFTNCSLCPRQGCGSRRAPYDAVLYGKRYGA
ncbi:MAG TPA: vitamin B12 dependent methionine synthase [Deltaproteobacteria bacterium]|nr:vitamin B12 dependent methionine synthase [Deltaproteobacteria bacterium]